MRIASVETLVVNADRRNWIFVKVTTDEGLHGWGEATLEWKTRSVVAAVEDLKELVIGHDPRDIVQNVRRMLKFSFWPQGPIGMSAISGMEQAMWDIFGKSCGQPVWRLLGGRCRDRVRVYAHLGLGQAQAVYGDHDAGRLRELAAELVELGYDAIKFLPVPIGAHTAPVADIDRAVRMTQVVRETVGDTVDLMLDFHGRPASTALAIAYIEALAPLRPMFVEEPIQPGDASAMRDVSSRVATPIATGERLLGLEGFMPLFKERAVAIVQPDLSHCGGLATASRIAATAEANLMGIAPHNPAGPVAAAAALHFAVATPNFVIQEEMSGAVPWFASVMSKNPMKREGNAWRVPDDPGLGIEIDEAAARAHPYRPERWSAAASVLADGSIVDR